MIPLYKVQKQEKPIIKLEVRVVPSSGQGQGFWFSDLWTM